MSEKLNLELYFTYSVSKSPESKIKDEHLFVCSFFPCIANVSMADIGQDDVSWIIADSKKAPFLVLMADARCSIADMTSLLWGKSIE